MLPGQLLIVSAFRGIGLYVELDMTRDEALALKADDVEALTELGATPEMFAALAALARTTRPQATLVLDFEHQMVTEAA